MKIRLVAFILMGFFTLSTASAQLTLDVCQEKARQNYPQIKQLDLIAKSVDYNISNANKAWLPQLSFSARATYQSEAISINLPVIGLDIALPKDQYQAVIEASQIVWDGGVTSSQKKIVKANAAVEKEKVEVELYALKDRVNQLFFGILLIKEQLMLNQTLQEELQSNFDRVSAFVTNGVANLSDLDAVKVEILNNDQRKIELEATQKSFCEMLSAMTGEKIHNNTLLEKPLIEYTKIGSEEVNRPEIKLFDSQINLFTNQENMIQASNMPKLGLFLQGGYGNPGLNMFKVGFSPFYIGGLKLAWNFNGFYTQKNNINTLKNNMKMAEVQKETFLFNNNLNISRQNIEIEKIREQIKSDNEIIKLRNNIKNASSVKVENGTMTVSDLLTEINAENMAKKQKALHEIQLLISIYSLRNSTNN
jgi:outer membrane protein TolC